MLLFIFFSLSLSLPPSLFTDQRLDLNKLSPNDSDTVRGQIVGEFWLTCPGIHLLTYVLNYVLHSFVLS